MGGREREGERGREMYLQKARDNMLIYILSQSLSHIFSLYGLRSVGAKVGFAQSGFPLSLSCFASLFLLLFSTISYF